MSMNKIGGSESDPWCSSLYIIGLIIGTAIRVVLFIIPIGIARRLEKILLPDDPATDDDNQSQQL